MARPLTLITCWNTHAVLLYRRTLCVPAAAQWSSTAVPALPAAQPTNLICARGSTAVQQESSTTHPACTRVSQTAPQLQRTAVQHAFAACTACTAYSCAIERYSSTYDLADCAQLTSPAMLERLSWVQASGLFLYMDSALSRAPYRQLSSVPSNTKPLAGGPPAAAGASTSLTVSASPPVRRTTGAAPYRSAIICVRPHGSNMEGTSTTSAAA
mmetsp:Transcript_19213/g.41512  ORF Transcript_19213/g.41512 Transcript_19213/m.41512 type:complete len:213 (-) Transcript_19213:1698-2336(-)